MIRDIIMAAAAAVLAPQGLQYVGGTSGVGSGTNTTYSVSLTSLVGGIASAPAEGDLVLVVTGWVNIVDGTPGVDTAGYTPLAELYANDSRDANMAVEWKIMGATPDTSVVAVGPGAVGDFYGVATVVQVWRGADQSNPIDVTTVTATGTNGAMPDAPSITPTTAGAVILACGLGTGDGTPQQFTTPSGMSNGISQTDSGSSAGVVVNIASYEDWVSGPYSPAAWTGGESGTSDSWCAATVVLRPAT